jgi:hypothetical protein
MGERVKSFSEGEESSQDTHHTNPDKNAEQKLSRETVVSMLYEAMVAHDSRKADKIIQDTHQSGYSIEELTEIYQEAFDKTIIE